MSETSQLPMALAMSSTEDSRAKTLAWLASALDWLESGAGSSSSLFGRLMLSARRSLSSKTLPVSCRLTDGETWEPSSGRWGSSGMGTPTECLTLNTSDWVSDGSVSTLSAALEPLSDVPRQYFLSPKACAGILRRAEKRGKTLASHLEAALRAVASGQQA